MNIWRYLEFLLAVKKAVDKVGKTEGESVPDDASPLAELFGTYNKCIAEIEDALEEVVLRGLAVDEIRLRSRREHNFLAALFAPSGTSEE